MRRVVLLVLVLGGCPRRDASDGVKPVPLAEQDAATKATTPVLLPGQRALIARITKYMGIGWGHVFAVDLEGLELGAHGAAALYVRAGDPLAKTMTLDAGSAIGLGLRLIVEPWVGPVQNGGPYATHLREWDEQGMRHWRVIRAELLPRPP